MKLYNKDAFMAKLYLLSVFSLLLLVGCTSTTQYQEVFIPIKCDIPYPVLQKQTSDVVQNQRNLVLYTKELETALDCCIKGECE